MKLLKLLFKILPWFFLALFGVEIAVVMLPKKMHFTAAPGDGRTVSEWSRRKKPRSRA